MIQITERKPSKRELTIALQCHSEQAADSSSSSVKDWSREPSESPPSHQEIGSPHVHDPVTLVILYITRGGDGNDLTTIVPLF